MAKTTAEQLEEITMDLQGDAMDARRASETLTENLQCAESCETIEDLEANLVEAQLVAKTLLEDINHAIKRLARKRARLAVAE